MDFLGKVIVTGKPHEGVEYRVRHIDGTWRWHTSSAVALTDENGSVVEYEGIARDITEQKLAEEKIKALLAEKELILKEVHHRIRNNMSTICGLILLQIYSIKDESSANALRDTERRISSMMLLYDKLYRSENFNEISVADYIPPLVDEIVRNFPNSGKVNIIKKVDDFILSAKKVQSVGIIINELLTNIMKHAFTGRDSGLITVTAEVKDGKAVIIITDDGIGIPEGIDFSTSKGFGMQLVSMLTTQLRGKISIERGEGARFALEFEI
jgi:two-component sensor histidine kinase